MSQCNNCNDLKIVSSFEIHWKNNSFTNAAIVWSSELPISLSQYLLWETCCKNCIYNDEICLRKEVKFLSVRLNVKFICVGMPVFETHFKCLIHVFLYIWHLYSFYCQRKFVYQFSTNNSFFSCKEQLFLLYCYIIPVLRFAFCL